MSQKLCPLTLEELGQNESTASRLEKVQMVHQAQGNEYSGWIYKKGRVNTAFQKRFLVLKDGMLSYYLARPLMENEKPQGSILTEICDCVEDLGTHPNTYTSYTGSCAGGSAHWAASHGPHRQ